MAVYPVVVVVVFAKVVVMVVSSVVSVVLAAVYSVWPWVPKPNRTSDTCRWGVVA